MISRSRLNFHWRFLNVKNGSEPLVVLSEQIRYRMLEGSALFRSLFFDTTRDGFLFCSGPLKGSDRAGVCTKRPLAGDVLL
jgi:hypothetical protein